MTGKRLVLFILLIVAVEFMLLSGVDCWRRRRRRRRYTPPPPPITTPKPTSAPCNSFIPWYPGITWMNRWQQPYFRAYCPSGYSISQWASLYRLCQQDRIHHFKCRSITGTIPATPYSYCYWTPFLNDVKHPIFYKCSGNGFITGVKSNFFDGSKDRRFELKCCTLDGYEPFNCHTTTTMNSFGGPLNYIVPRGYTMTGVTSFHSVTSSVSYSDRTWKFEICQVRKRPISGGKK